MILLMFDQILMCDFQDYHFFKDIIIFVFSKFPNDFLVLYGLLTEMLKCSALSAQCFSDFAPPNLTIHSDYCNKLFKEEKIIFLT